MSFEATRKTLQQRRDALANAQRTARDLGARITELEARRDALERGVDTHRLPPVTVSEEAAGDVTSVAALDARIDELQDEYRIEQEVVATERAEVAELSEEVLERIRDGPIAALDDDVPIALFPVRLETRYDADANDLLVRVYPDQIHVDSHEPELTAGEIASATEFWRAVFLSGRDEEISMPELARIVGEDAWRYDDAELLRVAVDEYGTEVHALLRDRAERDDDLSDRLFDRSSVVDLDDIAVDRDDFVVDLGATEDDEEPTGAELRHAARCREAWKRLATEYGPERAGWIVRTYRPTEASTLLSTPFEARPDVALSFSDDSDDPDAVARREESWTRAPHAAVLPDAWSVSVYVSDFDEPDVTTQGNTIPEDLAIGPTPGTTGASLPPVPDEATDEGLRWAVDFDAAQEVGMGIRVDLDGVIEPDDPPERRRIGRLLVTGIKATMDATASAKAVASLFEAHQYTDGLEFLPQGTPTNNTEEAAAGTDRTARLDTQAARACGTPVCADDGSLVRGTNDRDGELLAKALGITPSALGGTADDAHVFGRVVGAGGVEQRDAREMNTLLWDGTWGNYIRHLLPPNASGLTSLQMRALDLRTAGLWEGVDGDEPLIENTAEMRRLLGVLQGYEHHFVDYVRARGPFPALRVGNQPYGVLPTTPPGVGIDFDDGAPTERVTGWRPTSGTDLTARGMGSQVQNRVDRMRGTWQTAARSIPRLGTAGTTVADLYDVLSFESTSFGVFSGDLVEDQILGDMLFEFLRLKEQFEGPGPDFDPDRDPEDILGGGDIDPVDPWVLDLLGPLVSGGATLEEARILLTGSMQEVIDADLLNLVDDIRTDGGGWASDIVGQPETAGLTWLPQVGLYFTIRSKYLPLTPSRYDPPKTTADGRVRPPATPLVAADFRSTLETFLTSPPTVTDEWAPTDEDDLFVPLLRYSLLHAYLAADIRQGYLSDSGYVYNPPSASEFEASARGHHPTPDDPDLAAVMDALRYFQTGDHTPETVGRLLTETLDLASHRHDAWETSLATRRLDELRARDAGPDAGLHIGGYGWVENLRLDGEPSTLGFVDGPSPDHATTAAILRNGYLEYHGRTDDAVPENLEAMAELLSVSLTSRRVRLGLELLEGVRNGQRPADLLGYRFERSLHDYGPTLALDRFIADFRRAYPPTDWEMPTDNPDAVPPVVNGRALAEEWRQRGAGVFEADGLDELRTQAGGGNEREAVTASLDRLFEALDAVRDLLLVEAVHQLAKGDTTRAAAALDALRGEGAPPELDVVRTPRAAKSVTHRLLLLFDPDGAPAAGWPTGRAGEALDGPNVRGFAEPTLDAWAGTLLGDPTETVCRVEYAESSDAGAEVFETVRVSLADLGLSPLDVLSVVDEESTTADFEAYVRHHLGPGVPANVPETATLRLRTTRFGGLAADERSIAETFEVARSIRSLVTNARPASGRDLVLPEDGSRGYVTGHAGVVGARARTLQQDASEIEARLSTLLTCLTGEPHPDDPEQAVIGVETLDALVTSARSALDDGDRVVVATLANVDTATLADEVGTLLAVVADLEAEHSDRPPAAAAVTARLAGQSFLQLARIRALLPVDIDRLVATVAAIEAVHEGRDATLLETLCSESDTPLRTETYALLDAADVAAIRATRSALGPDLAPLSDEVRDVIEALTDLSATDAFVSLGTAPDEDTWAALSLADVRTELTAVQTTLADSGAITNTQAAANTYATLFDALDHLAAEEVLASVRGALQGDLRALLVRASFYGVVGAVPTPATDAKPTATDDSLVTQVAGVRATVRDRLETAAVPLAAASTHPHPTARYIEALEALLGDAFVALPPFTVPNRGELVPTLEEAHHATLTGDDDLVVETWFHRMARVRDGVDRFRRTYTYAEALASEAVRDLRVGQLPFIGDDRWVGAPIEDGREVNGRLSLVVETDATLNETETLTGLLVDEWVESIPEPTTTAGVSFQYDAPGSRAPQSVLLAVPPTDDGFTDESLRDTVVGAFELAQRRTVDFNENVIGPEGWYGELDRLFPAIAVLGLAGPDDPPIEADLSNLREETDE